jgi:hypothetical protein
LYKTFFVPSYSSRLRDVQAVVVQAWQLVVKVRRRTEAGDAPGWQGATSENIGNI